MLWAKNYCSEKDRKGTRLPFGFSKLNQLQLVTIYKETVLK